MHRKRTDTNHHAIAATFEKHGFRVRSTADLGDGFPDMVIARHGVGNVLIEAKDRKGHNGGRLNDRQALFHDTWPGPVFIVYSEQEADELAKCLRARREWNP